MHAAIMPSHIFPVTGYPHTKRHILGRVKKNTVTGKLRVRRQVVDNDKMNIDRKKRKTINNTLKKTEKRTGVSTVKQK
jgi:hypothetical protein